jgi:hypothetical protein
VIFWSRGLVCLVLMMGPVLAGCASTQLVNQWSNPAYTAPSFRKVMVIGITKQDRIRRNFEDQFADLLRAAGVDATPSYPYLRQDGPVAEAALKRAVNEAGADAVLVTRLVRIQKETEIAPGYYAPDPAMAVYSLYTTAWNSYYEPPIVYHTEIYTCETSLYDMRKNRLVWRGTAQTESLGDINKEIKNYAEIMTRELKERRLI